MPVQKIDPKVIFASDAPIIDKPPVFSDKTKGWDVARANDGRPTIKEMNKVQQDTDLKILWLNENSVTPYDESIDYPDGAVTLKDGSFKQLVSGAWVEFLENFANKDDVKRGIANRYDPSLTYNSGERVVLTNGDIVKSTIDGNTNDPNVDMTGWVEANTDLANVKYWGAKGDGVTDDSDAIQACVDAAIARQSNRIFFPFDLGEKYRMTKTVYIMSSGFHIDGNRTPTYQMHLYGGYIFADDNVVELFNYNDGQVFTSNQLTISGVAFYQDRPYVDLSQTFLRFDANNNGPHRGIIVSRCSARGFRKFLDLTVTNPANLSAANVVVHDGCVFTAGYDVVYAGNRLFNLLVNGIQAEQGAKFTGYIDGGISIKDSMLEGQSNVITIESNSPSVIIENNYTEYTAGEYFAKISGTNSNAYFDERSNYVSSINSTDYYLLTGILRFKMMESPQVREDRVSLVTLNKLVMVAGSVVTSSLYVGTSEPTDGVVGMCSPKSLPQPKSSAIFTKNIASDVFDTPFGRTTTGLINTGVGAYTTLSKTWNIGDIITVVALVKSDVSQVPIMQVYNQLDELQGTSGGAAIRQTSFEDWHVIVYSRPARIAGTSAKIRFSTGVNPLTVAAIGVDVTPASEFKVFNGRSRAEVCLFNPFVNQNSSVLSSTETFTIPEIAAGGTYTRSFAVLGAAIGDAVVVSPNVDLLGLDWFVRVSNTNNIQLRIVNRTASPISVGASTWRIKVLK